jgi:hypothetical protein
MANDTISVLQKLYDMANNHFRHGLTTLFVLKPAEVDYVLVSCVGGILLSAMHAITLARMGGMGGWDIG